MREKKKLFEQLATKTGGIGIFLFIVLSVFLPIVLSAGVFDLTPVVCNHKALWVVGSIVWTEFLSLIFFGKSNLKKFDTAKFVGFVAIVIAIAEYFIVRDC